MGVAGVLFEEQGLVGLESALGCFPWEHSLSAAGPETLKVQYYSQQCKISLSESVFQGRCSYGSEIFMDRNGRSVEPTLGKRSPPLSIGRSSGVSARKPGIGLRGAPFFH